MPETKTKKPLVHAKSKSEVASSAARWRLRMKKKGRCTQCGEKKGKSRFTGVCNKCGEKKSAAQRRRRGNKAWKKGGPGHPPLSAVA